MKQNEYIKSDFNLDLKCLIAFNKSPKFPSLLSILIDLLITCYYTLFLSQTCQTCLFSRKNNGINAETLIRIVKMLHAAILNRVLLLRVCGPFLDTKHPDNIPWILLCFFYPPYIFFLFSVFHSFPILSSSQNRGDEPWHTNDSVREKARNACQQKFAQTSNVIAGSSVLSSVPEIRDSWR